MQPDSRKVGAYLEAWLQSLTLRASTLLRLRSAYKTHVKCSGFANLKVREVTSDDVSAFYAELRKGGMSDSMVRKVHSLLHSAFEALTYTTNLRNPCDLPKNARPKYKAVRVPMPFDAVKEAEFLSAVAGDPWEALYTPALDAGMRQAELFALEWRDVDFITGSVEVNKTLTDIEGNCVAVGETKTRARRSIRISSKTVEALAVHKAAQRPQDNPLGLVFPDRLGGYMRRQNFDRRAFRAALKKATELAKEAKLDFSGHTFHDLRHTMATLLLQDGEAITRVSQRLGHSTIATTLAYYAHCVPQDEDRPAARFEERRRAAIAHRQPDRQPEPFFDVSEKLPKTPNPLQDVRLRNVPRARIELATPGFSDLCSTD